MRSLSSNVPSPGSGAWTYRRSLWHWMKPGRDASGTQAYRLALRPEGASARPAWSTASLGVPQSATAVAGSGAGRPPVRMPPSAARGPNHAWNLEGRLEFEPRTRGLKVSPAAVHGVRHGRSTRTARASAVHGLHGIGRRCTVVAVSVAVSDDGSRRRSRLIARRRADYGSGT
jgi:hypothetical protein